MRIQMPRRKREFIGITAIVLGAILSVWGGIRLGRKVEFWSGYLQNKLEAVYEGGNPSYSLEEIEQEAKHIRRSGYMAIGGLALVLGGAVIIGTRKKLPGISKPTDYGESLSTYRRGTREHPYRL